MSGDLHGLAIFVKRKVLNKLFGSQYTTKGKSPRKKKTNEGATVEQVETYLVYKMEWSHVSDCFFFVAVIERRCRAEEPDSKMKSKTH
jgi:hypothetical protein